MSDGFIAAWFAASVLCGMACVLIAIGKNRNLVVWGILGIAFGPIAILVAAAMSPAQNATAQACGPVAGVADELGKLVELKDRGVLTDEEFDEQKRRILA